MVISRLRTGRSDLSLTLNGVLGGLVGITAGCATVEPWAAVVIGIVAGAVIVFGVELLDNLKIDDPVGAVPVHLFNGIWGTLAVGLFTTQANLAPNYADSSNYGLLVGGGIEQLLFQAIGVLAVGVWTVVTSVILFTVIKYTVGLRVSESEEESGLDVAEHAMEAYPEFTGGRDPFGAALRRGGPCPAAPAPRLPAVRPRQTRRRLVQRVEAIIRPEKLDVVKSALEDLDHAGMTLTEVRGHGTQRGVTEQWRGRTFAVEYLTKVKIELVVKDEDVDAIVERIVDAARTGQVGDGKIFVSPVSRAVRIRTGEADEAAL